MPNLLERVEELHRRVTELEQRVPKPIPIVEPLAERVIRDAHEACGESPVFVEQRVPQRQLSDDEERALDWGRHTIVDDLAAAIKRAERAEAELREMHESLSAADWWIERWHTDEDHADDADWYVRKIDASLARARVAKAGP